MGVLYVAANHVGLGVGLTSNRLTLRNKCGLVTCNVHINPLYRIKLGLEEKHRRSTTCMFLTYFGIIFGFAATENSQLFFY